MISGENVGLRAVEFGDLGKLLEWRNKPEMRQYFRENRELNFDQQKTWFFDKCIKDPNTRMFSIVSTAHLLIGAAGLCYIDWVNGGADLSIYIGHEDRYIDEDLAPEAAGLLIDHAFNDLRLHRLWAEVYSFDKKKQAMFHALGFTVDGIHKEANWHAGEWRDSIYFSLLNR